MFPMQIYETFSSFGPARIHFEVVFRRYRHYMYYETNPTQKCQNFGSLAPLARNHCMMCFSRVSVFLVGINHHKQDHITSVTNTRTSFIVPTNHVIYQQNIEENRMFQTQKYHKFRLARNIAFSLVSGFPVG